MQSWKGSYTCANVRQFTTAVCDLMMRLKQSGARLTQIEGVDKNGVFSTTGILKFEVSGSDAELAIFRAE